MPPCPSGSHIKPALQALQWIVPDALCTPLVALTPWDLWLGPLCAALAPRLVRIDDLCTSPPPVYPEINPVALAEQGQLHVWSKNLDDWIWAAWVNANWAVLCECLPVTGPGPCPTVPPFGGGNITATVFAAHQVMGEVPIGHNWTTMTMKFVTSASNTVNTYCYANLLDASHAFLAQTSAVIGVGANVSFPFNTSNTTATQRANARYLQYTANNDTTASIVQHATLEVTGYTGSCTQDTTVTPPPPDPTPTPPPPTEPPPPAWPTTPCTPDDQCKLLYDVLRQLQRTGQLVELLQRFGLPFATIPGLLHGPFTGAGSFVVADLAGVQVDLQPPLPVRQLEGVPPYVWDAGWMSILTGDGMIEERRITRDTQVWQPRLIQEATTFGYFLKSGVSATFRELKPEPVGPNLGGP